MRAQNKISKIILTLFVFLVMLAGIQYWVIRQMNGIAGTSVSPRQPTDDASPADLVPEQNLRKEMAARSPVPIEEVSRKALLDQAPVTRRTRLGSKRGLYLTSIFYEGDREIARQKESGGKVYDRTGSIPDGEIVFDNLVQKTFGVEHYKGGERHGDYEEYFSNGRLKIQAGYRIGELLKKRVYFEDGALRREEDYTDALWVEGRRETGVGKIYAPSGRLVFEWQFTSAGQGGFKRTYDFNGEIVEEEYFDAQGNVVGKETE